MRRLLLLPLLAPALALAACGNSSPSSSGTTTTTGGSSTTAGAAGTSSGTATPVTGPSNQTAIFPAVGNAADLSVEPTIAAGTAPPPTTLQTRDLVVGTGKTATASDTVVVQYVGADYTNGQDFDSSWSRGGPSTFPLDGVVPGFAQGIEGMKVGGRREIVIPPALGYGAQGQPPAVGPNETLVFVVDLKAIQ